MTTRFGSREEALSRGLFYAGSKQKIEDLKIKTTEKMTNPLDIEGKYAEPVDIYEINGEKGKLEIGIAHSGNEWFLWLLADNGFAWRA